MSGIHVLRLGMGGGLKHFTQPFDVFDAGNGLVLQKVKCTFTIRRNGTLQASSFHQNFVRNDNWFLPGTPSAGDTFYVKAERISGSLFATEGLALNTVYQVSSDRTWFIDNEMSPGVYTQGVENIHLRFNFYTNSGGTGTPLSVIETIMEREWAV